MTQEPVISQVPSRRSSAEAGTVTSGMVFVVIPTVKDPDQSLPVTLSMTICEVKDQSKPLYIRQLPAQLEFPKAVTGGKIGGCARKEVLQVSVYCQ